MDGPQAGGQLHDDAPDFRFGQERTVLRSLHVAFVAVGITRSLSIRQHQTGLSFIPKGTGLAMEWIGIAVDIVGGCEILGHHRLRSGMVVVDQHQGCNEPNRTRC